MVQKADNTALMAPPVQLQCNCSIQAQVTRLSITLCVTRTMSSTIRFDFSRIKVYTYILKVRYYSDYGNNCIFSYFRQTYYVTPSHVGRKVLREVGHIYLDCALKHSLKVAIHKLASSDRLHNLYI